MQFTIILAFCAAIVQQATGQSVGLHPSCGGQGNKPAELPKDTYPWAKTALQDPKNQMIKITNPMSGTVYLSHNVLGSGRFGVVVKGCFAEQKKIVAVKVELVDTKSGNPIIVAQTLFNKVKNKLNNNNPQEELRILKETGNLIGQSESNGYRFTVMNMLPGISMEKYFNDPKLTSQGYLQAYSRVIQELDRQLHQQGLLHGAPHKNNVLLDYQPNGQVSVNFIDFGRGRNMDAKGVGERGYSKYLDNAIVQYYLLKFARQHHFESPAAKKQVMQELIKDLETSRKMHKQATKGYKGLDGILVPLGVQPEILYSKLNTFFQ
jgi:serine/threonine protein kinase